MSWRESVRKQINEAKSRRAENKITEAIIKRNKEFYEQNRDEDISFGKSLYYPSDENDDSYSEW